MIIKYKVARDIFSHLTIRTSKVSDKIIAFYKTHQRRKLTIPDSPHGCIHSYDLFLQKGTS